MRRKTYDHASTCPLRVLFSVSSIMRSSRKRPSSTSTPRSTPAREAARETLELEPPAVEARSSKVIRRVGAVFGQWMACEYDSTSDSCAVDGSLEITRGEDRVLEITRGEDRVLETEIGEAILESFDWTDIVSWVRWWGRWEERRFLGIGVFRRARIDPSQYPVAARVYHTRCISFIEITRRLTELLLHPSQLRLILSVLS
jgi:hypothetical protein